MLVRDVQIIGVDLGGQLSTYRERWLSIFQKEIDSIAISKHIYIIYI